jgi:hypothetical protein
MNRHVSTRELKHACDDGSFCHDMAFAIAAERDSLRRALAVVIQEQGRQFKLAEAANERAAQRERSEAEAWAKYRELKVAMREDIDRLLAVYRNRAERTILLLLEVKARQGDGSKELRERTRQLAEAQEEEKLLKNAIVRFCVKDRNETRM